MADNADRPTQSPTGTSPQATICGQFCCSDFFLFQDELGLSTGEDSLTSAILPLFAINYWENTSAGEYNTLRVTLRLASNMMRTDAFAEFIATAVDGDLYIDVDPNAGRSAKFVKPKPIPVPMEVTDRSNGHDQVFQHGYFQRRYYKGNIPILLKYMQDTEEESAHFLRRAALLRMPKRGRKTANPAMRLRATNLLAEMKGLFRFRAANIGRDNAAVNGRCTVMIGPLEERLASHFPLGRGFRISLNISRLRDVRNGQQEFRDGKITEVRLRMHEFTVANTIVHEIAHAITNAVNGLPLGGKVGFRENACIEAGYDLISHIFGGVMREGWRMLPIPQGPHMPEDDSSSKPYLFMFDWPSGLKFDSYTFRGSPIAKRGSLPQTDVLTRVPHAWLMKLFTNQFWTDHFATGGKGDLRPKGPRWTSLVQTKITKNYRMSSLVNDLPPAEVKKLLQIVTRQPSVKRALAELEDDLFIMSTAADAWPEEEKEPKIVSDAPLRRSSRLLGLGEREQARVRLPRRTLRPAAVKAARLGAMSALATSAIPTSVVVNGNKRRRTA